MVVNVKEVLVKFVCGDVDIVFCDIKMLDGNGVDLVCSFKGMGIDIYFIMVMVFVFMEIVVEVL